MLATGVLQGEATYQTLQVDAGGVIKGHTEPEVPPRALPDAGASAAGEST
jgi:hypothetical protein